MNTLEQSLAIAEEIRRLIPINEGLLTITLYTGEQRQVRLLSLNTSLTLKGYNGILITFTNDINNTTEYDIYNILEVN